MKLSKQQRAVLREMFGGKCAYCGCVLPEGWHADHVKAVWRDWGVVRDETGHAVVKENGIAKTRATGKLFAPENDCLDNLFPSCAACNIRKGAGTIEGFRGGLQSLPRVLRDNYSAYVHAERFGLVAQVETKVVFWFEKYKTKAAKIAAEEERHD